MDLGLWEARVLVTGASRGIGLEIARVFAGEGANLAICARSPQQLAEVADSLRTSGATVVPVALDVADPDSVRAFVKRAARELGGIDVVVSNVSAGSGTAEDQWERNLHTDLLPFVTLTDAARPYMEESPLPASVVLISTTSALHVTAPSGPKPYGPVKAALNAYAANLARELAPAGVRVNTVSPGPIEFPGGGWERRKEENPDFYDGIRSRIPLGRLGTPLEVARAVAFLASPVAGFITGRNLIVDGGFLDQV